MAHFTELLETKLKQLARAQGDLRLIDLASVHAVAAELALPVKEVELAALRLRIMPARYQRSLGTVGWDGQVRLLESTVAVVGAGGLGGWIIEGLARMGVGKIIVIDGDVFEENNLNRQALSREDLLGKSKAEAARRRVQEVNGAVEVAAHCLWMTAENAETLLQGAEVVVDALDKLPIRLMLQDICARLGIPMVHGAIGGYIGQVTTIFPGDPGLRALYGEGPVPERGVEMEWGNPAGTPMMVAAWQIQETIKLLTGRGTPLRRRLLFLDAESGTVECFQLG